MKINPQRVTIFNQDKIFEEIQDVFDTGMMAYSKYVKRWEEAFAKYVGTKHAIAVANGTVSLELMFRYYNKI